MAETNNTNFIKTLREGYLKSHITYDVQGRMEFVYEAHTDAKDQDKCLITQYVYHLLTTNIVKMKESVGTWLSSYNI